MGRRALVGVFVLLLVGCGGDDEPSEPTGASLKTFEIIETDFALEPSTVEIEEPGVYTFRAVNRGNVDHALEIEGEGIEVETEVIGPGETAELEVELERGTYELYCPVGDHKERGMDGSVTVGGGGGGEDEDKDDDGLDY